MINCPGSPQIRDGVHIMEMAYAGLVIPGDVICHYFRIYDGKRPGTADIIVFTDDDRSFVGAIWFCPLQIIVKYEPVSFSAVCIGKGMYVATSDGEKSHEAVVIVEIIRQRNFSFRVSP